MCDRAHAAGRHDAAAQPFGPAFGVAFHGEVERRLVAIGFGDQARGFRAVSLGPAFHQPFRRVARGAGGQLRFAALRHAAQHRIDQSGIARRAAVGLGQPHRKIDRGMVGHVKPEDLRGPDQQNGFGSRRFRRKSLLEEGGEQRAQGAEPPQHGGDQPAHQRAIAVGERGEARMRAFAGQLLVERDAPPQHAIENVGGDPSGSEAGDFRLGGGTRSRHGRNIAMNCGRVANGS